MDHHVSISDRSESKRPPSIDQQHDADVQLASAVAAVAPELTGILGGFLLAAGLTREQVAEVFSATATLALARDLRLEPAINHAWVQLSDAVALWWRDPTYLHDDGRPCDLPEFGPAPSIEALLARTVDETHRQNAKDLLARTAATVTGGVWRLSRAEPHLALAGNECAERLCIVLAGMLSTFVDNQRRVTEPAVLKNFDSGAHVAAFPVQLIPELRARLRRRLMMVLDDIDGWMTAAAAQQTDGPVALVGVTAYMHTSAPRHRDRPVGADDALPPVPHPTHPIEKR